MGWLNRRRNDTPSTGPAPGGADPPPTIETLPQLAPEHSAAAPDAPAPDAPAPAADGETPVPVGAPAGEGLGPATAEGADQPEEPAESTPPPAEPDAGDAHESPPAAAVAESATYDGSEATSGNTILEQLDERLVSMQGLLGRVLDEFEAKLRYDATKQQTIDTLHKENEQFKRDLLGKAVRPLVRAVLSLQRDMGKQAAAWSRKPEELTPERALELLANFQEDVEVLLENFGLDPHRPEPGEPFDARMQAIVSVTPTHEEERDRTVHECRQLGFVWNGQVMETAKVAVYRFERPK